MSGDLNALLGGLGKDQTFANNAAQAEMVRPDQVGVKASGASMAKAGGGASSAHSLSAVSDVLQDPTSTAHQFKQKADRCLAKGDMPGYFAYNDLAMTWAHNEARARA